MGLPLLPSTSIMGVQRPCFILSVRVSRYKPQPVRFLGGEFKDSLFHAPGRKTGNLPAEQRRNTLQTLLQTAGEFNLPGLTAQFFDDPHPQILPAD